MQMIQNGAETRFVATLECGGSQTLQTSLTTITELHKGAVCWHEKPICTDSSKVKVKHY